MPWALVSACSACMVRVGAEAMCVAIIHHASSFSWFSFVCVIGVLPPAGAIIVDSVLVPVILPILVPIVLSVLVPVLSVLVSVVSILVPVVSILVPVVLSVLISVVLPVIPSVSLVRAPILVSEWWSCVVCLEWRELLVIHVCLDVG